MANTHLVNVHGQVKTTMTDAAIEATALVWELYHHHFGTLPLTVNGDVAAWSEDHQILTIAIVNPAGYELATSSAVRLLPLDNNPAVCTPRAADCDPLRAVKVKPTIIQTRRGKMFIKKVLLTVLVAGAVMLAMGGGSTYAHFSESVAAWPSEPGWMSKEITVSSLDNIQFLPSVAYNSRHNEYLVVWHNMWSGGGFDIYAQRISGSGELKSGFSVTTAALPNNKAQPSVAYDPVNDRYLVTFIYDYYGDGSDYDLYGRFIPWDGPSASLSEFVICNWATHQWIPKVAYAGTQKEFLVVWSNEFQAGTPPKYISGRRIKAADGSFPGGTGSDVTINHTSENRVNPDVTYNLARNEYLVVYDNDVDVFATRLSGTAAKLGGGEFGIAGWPATEKHPAVAACNKTDQYLVAWQSLSSGADNDVFVRFIDGDGSFPTGGGPFGISNTTANEQYPDVACNSTTSGSMFLVTYEEQYSSITGPYGVWGQLVYQDYSMSSAFGIVEAGESLDRTEPVVAGGGSNYMVAWEHDRSASYQDIHGQLVSPYAVFLPLAVRNY